MGAGSPLISVLPPLFGRETETAELEATLHAAVSGRGSVVAITGPAGVGKSTVARRITDLATGDGHLVAWGRAEAGTTPPYWPWTQVVRDILALIPRDDLLPVMATRDRVLATIVPELSDQTTAERVPPTTFEVLDAVDALFEVAAALRPLVVVLDDLQWAGPTSLELLRYVARQAESRHQLVVAIARHPDDEYSDGLVATLRGVRRIPLAGLDPNATTALVGPTRLAPATIDHLHALSGGNPQLVRELAVQAEASALGPSGEPAGSAGRLTELARIAAQAHLQRLGPRTTSIVSAAAVAGTAEDILALVAMTGGEPADIDEGLERAAAIGLLTRTDGGYRFLHDLVREAVVASLEDHRRSQFAAALAAALIARGDEHLHARAAHALHAAMPRTEPTAVVNAYERAAQAASAQNAHGDAAGLLTQAVGVADAVDLPAMRRCALLLALADAQRRNSEPRAAEKTVRSALSVARDVGSEPFCRTAIALTDTFGDIGIIERQPSNLGLADEIAENVDDLDDPLLRAEVRAREARLRFWSGDVRRARRCVNEAKLGLDAAQPTRTAAAALHVRAAMPGMPFRGRRAMTDLAWTLSTRAADDRTMFDAAWWRAVDAAMDADRVAMLAAVERCRWLANRSRDGLSAARAAIVESSLALIEGRFDDAEGCIERMIESRNVLGLGVDPVWWHMALLARARGTIESMASLFEGIADRWPTLVVARAALAMVQAASGIPEAAKSIDRVVCNVVDLHELPHGGPTLGLTAMAVVALDDPTHAEALLSMLDRIDETCLMDESGAYAWLGAVDHHRGSLRRLLGDTATAIDLLEQGLNVHVSMGARAWAGESHLALGTAHTHRDHQHDARWAAHHFRAAADIGGDLGMAPLLLTAESAIPIPPARPALGPSLVRDDAGWRLSFAGETVHLADLRGLEHLHLLLASPHVPIDVGRLQGLPPDADEVAVERARVNVTRTVRAALARVRTHHREAHAHLAVSIHTGRACRYVPDEAFPDWVLH